MDLVKIKDFENHSIDKNNNWVYSHNYNRYLKSHINKSGYCYINLNKNKKQKYCLIHRLIYQVYNPDIDISKLQIDHIDNNKSNNNIENLRTCSASENQHNIKVKKNNLLGFKNISKTRCNTYQVRIEKNKKVNHKSFKTLEEAILWRDIKLIELHGEFHNLG